MSEVRASISISICIFLPYTFLYKDGTICIGSLYLTISLSLSFSVYSTVCLSLYIYIEKSKNVFKISKYILRKYWKNIYWVKDWAIKALYCYWESYSQLHKSFSHSNLATNSLSSSFVLLSFAVTCFRNFTI